MNINRRPKALFWENLHAPDPLSTRMLVLHIARFNPSVQMNACTPALEFIILLTDLEI